MALLEKLDQKAQHRGVMTVLMGRRRVGKTLLARHFVQKKRALYLFAGRKDESLLAQEYIEEIKKEWNIPILGEFRKIIDVFALLFELSKKQPFTLIVDEFQEFLNINPSLYSDLQKLFDLHRADIKLHLIFIGSVYSLMHKIFQNQHEPLFGRAEKIIQIQPFSIGTLKTILEKHQAMNERFWFDFFVLTGGVPKYVDLFLNESCQNLDDMLNLIFQKDSLFLTEGKNNLIEELGREYLNYFSILELISQGKTSRNALESVLQKDLGGYLDRLENDYHIIARHRSIHEKQNSRKQKYKIHDLFLNFWFRFIYKNRTALEIENFEYLKKIVIRDYNTYSGPILERFFQQSFSETGLFNQIGSYWEKDNKNEIDLVAINDMEQYIYVVETKLNPKRASLSELKEKAKTLIQHYPRYRCKYLILGLNDVLDLNNHLKDE